MRNICDGIDGHAQRDGSDDERGAVVCVEGVLVVGATLADAALNVSVEVTIEETVVPAQDLATRYGICGCVICARVALTIFGIVVCVLTFLSVTSATCATHVLSIEVKVVPGTLAHTVVV